jgi:hypothetical protein
MESDIARAGKVKATSVFPYAATPHILAIVAPIEA